MPAPASAFSPDSPEPIITALPTRTFLSYVIVHAVTGALAFPALYRPPPPPRPAPGLVNTDALRPSLLLCITGGALPH